MASAHVQKPSWLVFLLLATNALALSSSTSTNSPYWTYTSRFVKSTTVYTTTYTYRTNSVTSYTSSAYRTIKNGVTPTVSPTSIRTDSYYASVGDLALFYAYYPSGAVAESDLEPDYYTQSIYSSDTYTYIVYRMPVTWTAPAYCTGTDSTSFSVTTTVTPTIPSQVRDQITPTSKVTATSTNYYGYQTETWYLSAGAAPTTDDYYYSNYVASCTAPPSYGRTTTASSGGGSGSSDYGDLNVCSWYSGCTSLKTWIIIIASVIPGIFILGFFESYFWFRRLMLGKGCLRFGTVLWICLSLWVACFTRTQSARSKDDQKLLRENWNKIGTGQALKLWFKWGFRHRYPVPLLGQYSRNTVGIVPEGEPLPQMGQPNVMFPPGAPGATGIIYYNGQPYYAPPQGWVPQNGQTQPVPPPGTAYITPQHGAPVYYGEHYGMSQQTKEASNVEVSPIQQNATPQPIASPISAPNIVPTPPTHYSEAYAPPASQPQQSESPTMSGAQPAPPQNPPSQGPPPSHPA